MSSQSNIPAPNRLLTLGYSKAPTRLYQQFRQEMNQFAASLCVDVHQGGLEAFGVLMTNPEYLLSRVNVVDVGVDPNQRFVPIPPNIPNENALSAAFSRYNVESARYMSFMNGYARLKAVLVDVLGIEIIENMTNRNIPLQEWQTYDIINYITALYGIIYPIYARSIQDKM
jgi:hypothetical protein